MKFRTSGPRALLISVCASGLIGLFSACGQTPGETGLAYIEDQGGRVSAPLYHLVLDSLPLDTVFAVESPMNNFGESLMVVGRDDSYAARARLGFQITTRSQRDSLVNGLYLRLGVLPLTGAIAGPAWLRSSSQNRDSLTLLVESFSWPDGGAGSYSDSLSAFHRRILVTPAPFSTLDTQFRRRDTIRIYPARAYPDTGVVQDSSQAGMLPNLWNRLRTEHGGDTARRWIVYVELSPLTPADSGLFPFVVQVEGFRTTDRRYHSGLWLGRYAPDSIMTVGTLVTPYRSGFTLIPASNYEVVHTGASTRSLLHGVSRGLHLRINRDTLLQRIRVKLNARDPADPTLGDRLLGSGPNGSQFDRRFYVPYARLRLPVDTALTRVQGPFALDMSLTSGVDSLDSDMTSFEETVVIPLNMSERLPVRGGGSSSDPDTLVVSYRPHPGDTALRQVLFHWASQPSAADTFNVAPNGLRRELSARRKTGWPRATTVTVRPEAAQLGVDVYFTVASIVEPSYFLKSDGSQVTSAASLSERFWRPGVDSLNVRATHGIRNLLNRVHGPGTNSVPDMLLQSVRRAAYDTTTISSLPYRLVKYPIFGEIDLKRGTGGQVEVGLELYLYPLEARP